VVNSGYLQLANPNQSISLVSTVDYTVKTVWGMETDKEGRSMIYTALYNGTARTVYCLGRDGDKVVAVHRPNSKQADYETHMATVKWNVAIIVDSERD
jgi:hypothetical protein